ncbi:GNAT family N-acetyltransferase [Desulfosporosinus sp. PR]|uniref:GNAT family N-acetyltransferase n=1 Tax=Candidatus Desulfosporosinus nitrosoreducens TaxID=3401928 RepID=UPI0027FA5D18|nr:GNAT family N-acetyltransferase [Desulfosporosinus sp. PR]MDQ7097040.1 GNAT family N-acetyltransferase [Desulfosporosinus sp. PR]
MPRKAVLDDIPQIMEIIKQTIPEMHSYQNYQWDENYPLAKDFQMDVEVGNLYVIEDRGELVAFICVNKVEPEEYSELDWSSMQESMVIHRMSVHPAYRRKGLGVELMNLAETIARKSHILYLKTDTNSRNEKMKTLFTKCGYGFIGEIRFPSKEAPFYCYDKLID